MSIIAIDPGNEESAFVCYDSQTETILDKGKRLNADIIKGLFCARGDVLVIEQVACMGMAVGAEVFETVFWSGRFAQEWEKQACKPWHRIKRHQIKMHLCGTMRAKDGNIRQALIDKLGAPGTKKKPGKTYGVSKDIWAALAIAVTFAETSEWAKHGRGLVS
jgi:hypothetical protein